MGTYLNAKRNKRDIYVAYIDFSSAFNTISHQKLAYTMSALGFPTDAADVVHNLYQIRRTSITNRQPAFQTPDIDIKQGVVQGDSLSPLIFNICMDPLLKWLQTGGRGYNTRIRTSSGNLTMSALAYADDLTIICGTAKDLQRQLHKLDHYCQWMGLDVNASKCDIQAVKWSDTDPLGNSTLRMVRREITGKDDNNNQVGTGIQILTSSGIKPYPTWNQQHLSDTWEHKSRRH
jgi:Reverse transcriptase (RNA-dependent DNA polymerase)